MTKSEFLEELNDTLQGEVNEFERQNSLNYYSNYIDDEIKKGKTEQEVLLSLGNGIMIGKSIIDANSSGKKNSFDDVMNDEDDILKNERQNKNFGDKWYEKIIKAFIIVFIFMILFWFIKNLVIPVALIFLLIYLVKKIINR